jgi:hypothetical protein
MGKKKHGLRALALSVLLWAFGAVNANAAVVFTEDFSSGTFDKWTNAVLDDDPDTDDKELVDVAKIENGMLYINNKATGGSFFYIAPKDIKAKNFTISMRAKSLDFSGSWIGFSVRKDTNERFNGSNNVLHTFIMNETGIAFHAYRGYPGGGGVVSLAKQTTQNEPFTNNIEDWHTYTLIVKDNLFTAMVDDQIVGVVDYSNNRINEAGYISINVCIGEVYIDDVQLEVHDDSASADQPEQPAQQEPKAPAESPSSGTPNNNGQQSGGASSAPSSGNEDAPASSDPVKEEEASSEGDAAQEEQSEQEALAQEEQPDAADPQDAPEDSAAEDEESGTVSAPPADAADSGNGGGGSGWIWIVVAVVVAAAAGAAYYYFVMRKKKSAA